MTNLKISGDAIIYANLCDAVLVAHDIYAVDVDV